MVVGEGSVVDRDEPYASAHDRQALHDRVDPAAHRPAAHEHPVKPRRTHVSTGVYRLTGGTEDNDLWTVAYDPDEGGPAIGSTWEPTDEERAAIAAGANIELIVFGTEQPPVALRTCTYLLGNPSADHGPPLPAPMCACGHPAAAHHGVITGDGGGCLVRGCSCRALQ